VTENKWQGVEFVGECTNKCLPSGTAFIKKKKMHQNLFLVLATTQKIMSSKIATFN
jgi:hypothetical protein